LSFSKITFIIYSFIAPEEVNTYTYETHTHTHTHESTQHLHNNVAALHINYH